MAKKRSNTSREMELPGADDFKIINGIGPAVEARLHRVGIYTFAQLANLTPADIAASVSDLSGLTAERIIKQDWLGQARQLSRESTPMESQKDTENVIEPDQHSRFAVKLEEDIQTPMEPQQHAQLEVEPQEDAKAQNGLQPHATFTVELLLNEDNEVLSTELVHVQSGEKESLVGWQASQLIDFLVQRAGLKLLPVETSPPIPEVTSPAPLPAAPTGALNVLHLRELETVSVATNDQCGILPSDQPFDVRLTLDFTDVKVPGNSALNYKANIYARRLGDRRRQTVGETQGTISVIPEDKAIINVEGTALQQGIYRLEAAVKLTMTAMDTPLQPELMAHMKGGLLQIY